MVNNEIFKILCYKIIYEHNYDIFNTLIVFYDSLSVTEKNKIDKEEIEKFILKDIKMGKIKFDTIDKYCNIVNSKFRNKVNYVIENDCYNTLILCEYVNLNSLNNDKFINLSVRAIGAVYIENEVQNNALMDLKNQLQEKGLYDRVINVIKNSGDIELIVCAALCIESKLIDEIFMGKESMYLYLLANTFTDDENIEFYMKRLLNMDNFELKKNIKKKARNINSFIKNNCD